jgi:serine/threonine protein kinase
LAAEQLLPRNIGRYEILRLLGRGGMGEVYLASDSALGRRVAIKILPAALQSDAKMRGRFMNEARAVAALNHPNVITIHDLATTDARDAGFPPGALYLVLEYLEGKGLDEIMDKRRLSIPECLDIAIQALEGLRVAHQSRILHRDVTPSNLMLAPDGHVKVLDFGLSKLLAEGARDTSRSHRQTGEGMIVGTLDYLSPEQALGNPLDERSDLFSLGIVFYQMLAGAHPFSGASVTQMVAKMMTKEADPWPEPDLVPESLKQIVARALRKEPSERYGGAGQMILDLVVARRELQATPVGGAVTREVPAAAPAPASPPAAVAPSTAPLRQRRRSTAPRTSDLPSPRKGPLLLLLGASLVLLAGAATFLAARGCAAPRASAPSSSPAR